MHTGMLWFDGSKDSLLVKITKGVEYYHKKHKRIPDLILVHPSMLEKDVQKMEIEINTETRVTSHTEGRIESVLETGKIQIVVRGYRPVLPGHIWIGIEDKS